MLEDNAAYEFTCCDLEPAVLGERFSFELLYISDAHTSAARNIILFTLIANKANSTGVGEADNRAKAVWNIFYHMYISDGDLNLLQQQARELVQYSGTDDAWVSSPYGKYIKLLSEDTRVRLRKIWSFYAAPTEWIPSSTKAFELRARKVIASTYKVK